MTGAQILNNSWVWYRHNIIPMIKMSNRKITQGAETTGLGVTIVGCSPNSQHEDQIVILKILAILFSRNTNDDISNHTNQGHQHKNGRGKTTKMHLSVIFGATQHKEDIGKERKRSGKNALGIRQQAKDSRTMSGR